MAIKKSDFSAKVESLVKETEDSYLEACIAVAEELDIDEERIPRLISEPLRQKIELEALDAKTIKPAGKPHTDSLSAWF